MKLEKLKNKLEEKLLKKGYNSEKKIKKEFKENEKVKKLLGKQKSLDELKIIGITGSRGKSSVAYIVHEYLKLLGYKSVLYSSAKIDSPVSIIPNDEACEVSFNTEEELLDIIEETECYEADYLVLEVNESTIQKGLTKDIPFDIRVLTNLNPKHNLEDYSESEYVKIKKSFFENIDDECKCVIGFQNYTKELFEEILSLNTCPKVTFSSKYIASVNNINQDDLTCLLEDLNNTLTGLDMNIKIKDKRVHLNTKMMMNYNAMNFLCVASILEALNILDEEKLNKCIKDIKIPGRAEIYHKNGRLIVVDTQLSMMLEGLKTLKNKEEIKRIKVVIGSMGSGYKYWEERFKTPKFLKSRTIVKKYACELLKQSADYVYLTENDNGAESVTDICTELQNYLEGQVSSIIIEDRESAIRQAILDSKDGDAIFISGRGNRRVLCKSATTMKLVKDSEVVEKVLKELGW